MFEIGRKTTTNFGTCVYFDTQDKLHCLIGPAQIWPNGRLCYYIHGQELTKERWDEQIEVIYKTQVHLLKQKLVNCWVMARILNNQDLIILTEDYNVQMEKLLDERLDPDVAQALLSFLIHGRLPSEKGEEHEI